MFADIKNQVIVEAGEKREASGSPKEASKAHNKRKGPPKKQQSRSKLSPERSSGARFTKFKLNYDQYSTFNE